MAVVIEIEMCNHWMVHCRLYISTTYFNYNISAKGHYVKLLRRKLYDKREGSISHRELSILYADIFQDHLHISQLFRYSRAFGSFHDFLDRGLRCLLKGSYHFGSFTVANKTKETITEDLCHK